MQKFNAWDWTAIILVIVGGLNWGLVGAIDFNLVEAIFKSWPIVENIIYILVGLSAIYVAVNVSGYRKGE